MPMPLNPWWLRLRDRWRKVLVMPGWQGYLLASLVLAILFAIIEAILSPVMALLLGPFRYFPGVLFICPGWGLIMSWFLRSSAGQRGWRK